MANKLILPGAHEARLIRIEHEKLAAELESAGHRAERIGELLRAARGKVGNGDWGNWVQDNCPFGVRQAQLYLTFQARVQAFAEPTQALLNAEWWDLTHGERRDPVALLPADENGAALAPEGGVQPDDEGDERATPDQPSGEDGTPAAEAPPAEAETPKDGIGMPIPEHLRGVFAKTPEFYGLARTVSAIKSQVKQAAQADPAAWDRFNLNAFGAGCDNLRDLLTLSGPYAVCLYCRAEQAADCTACKGTGWLSKVQHRAVTKELKDMAKARTTP
jgi:hypothetical protein